LPTAEHLIHFILFFFRPRHLFQTTLTLPHQAGLTQSMAKHPEDSTTAKLSAVLVVISLSLMTVVATIFGMVIEVGRMESAVEVEVVEIMMLEARGMRVKWSI